MKESDFEEEKLKLLGEIHDLKRAVDWYKKTYEQRSLPGLIYNRLFKGLFTKSTQRKVKISKSNTRVPVLCSIVNHNYSKNATALRQLMQHYFDTILLDSDSKNPPKGSIKLENVYYSGLLNIAYEIARNNNYEYLLFICSDVLINPSEAEKIYNRISNIDLKKIGVYSPSSSGLSHHFCKNYHTGVMREVPFTEGFIFLCDMEILSKICPINTQLNLYGWGIDIAQAFFAKETNKLCVIDDAAEVEHLAGTGYSREAAKIDMLRWIKSSKNEELIKFFENIHNVVDGD